MNSFGGSVSQHAEQSDVVVIPPPDFDLGSPVLQTDEPASVQTLVSRLAFEALDEAVLLGLAWLNEVPPDLPSRPALAPRIPARCTFSISKRNVLCNCA